MKYLRVNTSMPNVARFSRHEDLVSYGGAYNRV